jgi:hypothetical protein
MKGDRGQAGYLRSRSSLKGKVGERGEVLRDWWSRAVHYSLSVFNEEGESEEGRGNPPSLHLIPH